MLFTTICSIRDFVFIPLKAMTNLLLTSMVQEQAYSDYAALLYSTWLFQTAVKNWQVGLIVLNYGYFILPG